MVNPHIVLRPASGPQPYPKTHSCHVLRPASGPQPSPKDTQLPCSQTSFRSTAISQRHTAAMFSDQLPVHSHIQRHTAAMFSDQLPVHSHLPKTHSCHVLRPASGPQPSPKDTQLPCSQTSFRSTAISQRHTAAMFSDQLPVHSHLPKTHSCHVLRPASGPQPSPKDTQLPCSQTSFRSTAISQRHTAAMFSDQLPVHSHLPKTHSCHVLRPASGPQPSPKDTQPCSTQSHAMHYVTQKHGQIF